MEKERWTEMQREMDRDRLGEREEERERETECVGVWLTYLYGRDRVGLLVT